MREATAMSRRSRWRMGAAEVLLGMLIGGSSPLAAANREHAQMMADIRMLQEQNQQLQATLGTLLDALKDGPRRASIRRRKRRARPPPIRSC